MRINEERKRRASEFISVRHVMKEVSQLSGLSVGEVAGEFIYYLDQPGKYPSFHRQNPATLTISQSDGAFMRAIFNSIVRWGRLDWPDRSLPLPSDLDEFGWNREEIGTFLLAFMGILPDCCDPTWEPVPELLPIPLSDSSDGQAIEYPTLDDFDHEKWPERLGIALTAWRAACNADLSGTTPREYMKTWLMENYPSMSEIEAERLATVANWDISRGRPPKKQINRHAISNPRTTMICGFWMGISGKFSNK